MKLDELADQYRLNLAVPDIVDEVERVSAKEIDFRPIPRLDVRARTKMARRSMSRHIILFNPKEWPHLSHILAHECARILRVFETPPDDRRVPASTPETLRAARKEIRPEAKFLPSDLRDDMVDRWIHGLIVQATSQPVDVRIEQWISDNYPSLREGQRRSLRTDTRIITANISPDIKLTTPHTIFQRSNALNYAYLDHIGRIMQRSFDSKFRHHPQILALGQTLSQILRNNHISDLELVNRIAAASHVRHWFVWLSFEEMPASYYVT